MPSAWRQRWGAGFLGEILRWQRYVDRPSDGGTWLAFDRDECLAVIDSFIRPYLLDFRRVLVRETADWFRLAKYRPLGLKPMRIMMASPEAIVVIGGTDATVSLLPRLGWKRLPAVQRMILPVTLRSLVGNLLLRRRGSRSVKAAAAIPGSNPVRLPRKVALRPARGGSKAPGPNESSAFLSHDERVSSSSLSLPTSIGSSRHHVAFRFAADGSPLLARW